VRNGPVTQQDRWEEDGGYSPFTSLRRSPHCSQPPISPNSPAIAIFASTLRDHADAWNEQYRTLGLRHRRRSRPANRRRRLLRPHSPAHHRCLPRRPRKASPHQESSSRSSMERAFRIVSPDSLALVRFGTARRQRSCILNTVRVIDAFAPVQLPQGACWYRYNGDGYGEHKKPAPLRRHRALAAPGRLWLADAPPTTNSLRTPQRSRSSIDPLWKTPPPSQPPASRTSLDADDIPRSNFSAANQRLRLSAGVGPFPNHQLRRSARSQNFSTSLPTVQRYQVEKPPPNLLGWRFTTKPAPSRYKKSSPRPHDPALVHWSMQQLEKLRLIPPPRYGLDTYILDLPTASLPIGAQIIFTFYWPQENRLGRKRLRR